MAATIKIQSPSALQKTTFDVLGMCCASEASLIHKILNPIPGIENVSVNISAKTALVIHDPDLVPASQIAKSLNKARLNAGIRELGQLKTNKQSWPSPYTIGSGIFMVVALFGYIYPPLKWFGLASIAVGLPNMLLRSFAALRQCMMDINVLMVVAVRIITELKSNGVTGMVGDGINDAPALAAADLGIAMGVAGSAIAMETADVALMSNNLTKIGEAIKLARRSSRKVYQNVAFSLVVKLVFFGLTFGGVASLWAAVAADMGTCLVVIFNSMLLLKKNKNPPCSDQENKNEGVHKIEAESISGSSGADNGEFRRRGDGYELREPLLEEIGGGREAREGENISCCSGCCRVVVVENGGSAAQE